MLKPLQSQGNVLTKGLTATFSITFSNHFLSMQLIYGGKTAASYPKFDFPFSFSLSANEKHFSN